MTTLLLKELSNSDIDWMLQNSTPIHMMAGDLLAPSDQFSEPLYILLQGSLKAWFTPAAATGSPPGMMLSSGDLIGTVPTLDRILPCATVSALTDTSLLVIPQRSLERKLQDDRDFAAHLYRICAQMLANRLVALVQQGRNLEFSRLQLKQAARVFAELQDPDLDWLIAVGQVQTLGAGAVLQQQGRPVEALHILLEGAVTLTMATEVQPSPLICALRLAGASGPQQEFARLSRGDLIGETVFVDTLPPIFSVQTLRECQILSVPRWRLETKLRYDTGFAARLYHILAGLLANQQQLLLQQLGVVAESPEISNQVLNRLALAEARFEWMVKRIQSQPVGGRELRW